MLPLSRSLSLRTSVGLIALMFCVLIPQTSNAQVWTRTARVVAPIEPGGVSHAFLDTLVHVAEEKPGITVRSSPDRKQEVPISVLRDSLDRAYNLDIMEADHVIIGYRFSIADGEGFKKKITDLHFLYRGTHEIDDLSILYLDPETEWVRSILHNKGMSLETNRAGFLSFREQLGFVPLTKLPESDVIEIGGKTVREGFDAVKLALIQQVHHLTYSDVYNDAN